MMRILLKNQWKMLMNTIRTQPGKNIVGYVIGMIVVAFFLYLFSAGVWLISPRLDSSIAEGTLSIILLMMIAFVILLGVPQVFKNLYSGSDLEMLFTMPIPTRHIFWIKYIHSFFGTPLFAFVTFAVPVIVYGMATKVSLLFYPIALITLLAVTIIGLSFAYLFNLIVIQIVPVSRANEFMTVMSFLSGILVYLVIMLPNMMNDEPLTEVILSGVPILPKWIPVTWGSMAIMEASNGSFRALLLLILLLVLTGVMMFITTLLVEKGFRTGFIRLSEGSSKKQKRRRTKGKGQKTKIRHPIIAVGKKEWFSIKRDVREWLMFLPIVIFIIFGGIGFLSGGGNLADIRGYGEISWPVAQGIILFVYALANGIISASSIGREGENLWIVQVMPLTGRQTALGKLWISWLLPFGLLVIIETVLAILLGWTVFQLLFGLIIIAVLTLGMSSMGLWLGTLGAKYHPTNPQARLNFGVSIILFLLSYIYLFIMMLPIAYLIIPIGQFELPAGLDHGIPGFWGLIASIALTLLAWKISHPIIMTIVGLFVLMIMAFGLTSLFVYLSAQQIDKGLKINMVSEAGAKPLFGKNKSGTSLY